MKLNHTPSPMTARELLVATAGDEHQLHTVVSRESAHGLLRFKCSCGDEVFVDDIEFNRMALRNVAEVAS